MKILAIDTSTMFGSVAICDGDNLVAEEQLGVEVTHSERLVATIENMLAHAKWGRAEIGGIAVAIGPGSFTGLRIGLATAKGLSLGLNKPIAGVSSLLVLAYNGVLQNDTVVSIIDARRGEVYAAAYRFEKGKPKQIMDESIFDPKLLCNKLLEFTKDVSCTSVRAEPVEARSIRPSTSSGRTGKTKLFLQRPLEKNGGGLLLVGDGVCTYEKTFVSELKGKARMMPGELKFPHASHLAQIAFGCLKRGGDDVVKLVPNYLRHSDAEIGFRGKTAIHRRVAEGAERK